MAKKVGKPLGISEAKEDEEGMVNWSKGCRKNNENEDPEKAMVS